VPKKIKVKKKISEKKIFNESDVTSSAPLIHPNATLTPEASISGSTNASFLSADSTTAPRIGEESEDSNDYARSHAALIDKYFLSKQAIPFPLLIVLIVICFVFIQDNWAGKLTNWDGIFWTLKKAGVLIGLFVLVLLIRPLYRKIFKQSI